MIRTKTVAPLLAAANTDGVHSTMLLAADGRLLCFSSAAESVEVDRVVGSVASHAFAEYQSAARTSFDRAHDLEFVFFEMEAGHIAILPVNENFVLCCYTAPTASISAVKLKVGGFSRVLHLTTLSMPDSALQLEALKRLLAGPLSLVGSTET